MAGNKISEETLDVTPNQTLKEHDKHEDTVVKPHIANPGTKGSSELNGTRQNTQETIGSYLCVTKKKYPLISCYDRIFHRPLGYDPRLHRDDREVKFMINVNAEERGRIVPVLSSSAYGRRIDKPLEITSKEHGHLDVILKEFYHPRGTNLPPFD
ncbi:uncharacterized protein LOC106705291 [Latimeria chalumnae]|uniref:uncharacterized protein LOC106705291 n=1 Tax=Latimeria chalumnae TaxID=7897 RepID=UPI0006D92B20|nr:PREDICTED: uncharacterized protein LOC106705291 [Latimeria chalumnae]|eukprot:XP_014349757.1 PREDICTED: uncharacterized protein LOC106705291 [Latimeria chalumnae]